jgi:hypothetical protein
MGDINLTEDGFQLTSSAYKGHLNRKQTLLVYNMSWLTLGETSI